MSIYYVFIALSLLFGYLYSLDFVNRNKVYKTVLLLYFILVFSFVFGLRDEVGVDWYNYIVVYERYIASGFNFESIEIGYIILNLTSEYLGLGIHFVILICTFLFITLTLYGAKRININPFYFFSVIAPYHFVMSGMNLTRQSVAMSFFIFSFYYLFRNKKTGFITCIIVGASFHASILPFILLFALNMKLRYVYLVSLIFSPVVLFYILSVSRYQHYLNESTMDSAGFYLRTLYLLSPVILVFLFRSRLVINTVIERRMMLIVMFSFPTLILISTFHSSIADRYAYYFILLSTMMWFYINKSRSVKFQLRYYGNAILFFTSMLALIVWHLYSNYIGYYEFGHLISFF